MIQDESERQVFLSAIDEVNLNNHLRNFALNCSVIYGGRNTVKEQINFNSNEEYTEMDGDEQLPLGKEFQSLVNIFINKSETDVILKYQMAEKLVLQLKFVN